MLLFSGPSLPDLHDPVVHPPQDEVEDLLLVGPDNVLEQVLTEPLHLDGQHLLGGTVGVPGTDDVPLDVEVVGASDDVILHHLWDLFLDTFCQAWDWLELYHPLILYL